MTLQLPRNTEVTVVDPVQKTTKFSQVWNIFFSLLAKLEWVATAGNIAFPATQVPSTDANTLDDYEEGTFTPTIFGTTAAGVGTYAAQTGNYTKIGNRVFIDIYLSWTAHTGTGDMEIRGLPFTAAANSGAALSYWDLTFTGVVRGHFGNGTTSIVLLHATTFTPLPIDAVGSIIAGGAYKF